MSGVGTRGRGGEVFGRRTMSRSRRRRTRLWRTRRREGRKKRVKGKRKRMGNVEKREGRGERERARQSEVEGFRKIGCKTRQDERGSERRDRERRRGGRNSFTFSRAHLVSLESSFPFSFLLLPSPQTPPPRPPPTSFFLRRHGWNVAQGYVALVEMEREAEDGTKKLTISTIDLA